MYNMYCTLTLGAVSKIVPLRLTQKRTVSKISPTARETTYPRSKDHRDTLAMKHVSPKSKAVTPIVMDRMVSLKNNRENSWTGGSLQPLTISSQMSSCITVANRPIYICKGQKTRNSVLLNCE